MKKYRKAVFIVAYAREKSKTYYVILKRKKHWYGWEFPKGGVEGKESLVKTVKREVFEETGLNAMGIKSHSIVGKYRYNKILEDRRGFIGQTYTLFSAEVKKGKIKVDKKEHYLGKWMEFNRAIKKLTHINQRKCLRIVDKELR